MEEYEAPLRQQRFEIEIKRSRFITTIAFAENKVDTKSFITSVRTEFPDANHHCWAAIRGAPDDDRAQDQHDDGEPRGTAGKPMLNVLRHSGLGNIVVVVTRYFGGIKLGAGGLVRAYTRAVSEPLKTLDTQTILRRQSLSIELPYSSLSPLEHWLSSMQSEISDKIFSQTVQLQLKAPSSEIAFLKARVTELRGKITDGE